MDDFAALLSFEPEEATSLGLHTKRWRRYDEEGLADEDAFLASLTPADDVHGQALARWVRWRRHVLANDWQGRATEAWALCQATLTLEQVRGLDEAGWVRLSWRLSRLHEPLDALAAHHRRAARAGNCGHPATWQAVATEVDAFAEHLDLCKPHWADRAPAALIPAREAAQRFAALAHELGRTAPVPPPLGTDEVDFRLTETMGLPPSVELRRLAQSGLAETHRALVEVARRLDPTVDDLHGVSRVLQDVLAARMSKDVLAHYRSHVERATALVRELDPDLLPGPVELVIAPAPAGVPHAANWPAPLLRPGPGCFFVRPDPGSHSLAWSADLAVHEAVPGHYLQSAAWQARFAAHPAPFACLFLSDPVAVAHQFYGPMSMVEGWAVYAERWMADAGLFTDAELLCARVSDAIRWARLDVDLGLHTGALTEAQAIDRVASATCLGTGFATGEVRRYQRIPLQACTYAAGLVAIEALRDGWQGPGFHRWLLDQGPVPPHALRVP